MEFHGASELTRRWAESLTETELAFYLDHSPEWIRATSGPGPLRAMRHGVALRALSAICAAEYRARQRPPSA